jgi:chemotaxis protein MotB
MRMRPNKTTPNHRDRWLISYADLLTLLFAFFTTLYALSSIDAKKAASLSIAMQKAFHHKGGVEDDPAFLQAPDNPSKSEREALLNELTKSISSEFKGKITVREESRGIVISLADSAFFASGSAQLQSGAQSALGDLAKELRKKELDILIEGHTDDLPVSGRFKTNWELSTARATTVVLFFIEQHFNPQRLSAAGYGPYRPLSTNQTPEGRANNRRVDLVLQEIHLQERQ